jgi:CheY-like chemotaxis protein
MNAAEPRVPSELSGGATADRESRAEQQARSAKPPVALVVDPDSVSRRFVELALGNNGCFAVEGARDATGALDVLGTQVVDVIVSDTTLPDMNGLRFYRTLSQESRLRKVPFVFLSADKRIETKVAALRAGADDYLTKPCSAVELLARAEALVQRQRRERDAARNRRYTLAGDFVAIEFADLVSIIEMGRRSGVLSIVGPDAGGSVHFENGRVVHATYANIEGPEAFYLFLAAPAGHFEFMATESPIPEPAQTIRSSVTALIMEGARLLDTDRRLSSANGRVSAVAALRSTRLASTVPPPRVRDALAPESILAAQLELAVRDPFALGEVRLWTHEELAKWTRADVGTDRLHVHLIADLAAGVSAILPLAGSATERWILGGLSPEAKAFGVTFFLRHERTIDLVLLDATQPCSFEHALQRRPTITIVAPPDGEFLAMGTSSLVALDRLFRHLPPAALVGVGNASMDERLRGIPSVAARCPTVRCVRGLLGEDACDLRSILIKGIRLWASAAAVPHPAGGGA